MAQTLPGYISVTTFLQSDYHLAYEQPRCLRIPLSESHGHQRSFRRILQLDVLLWVVLGIIKFGRLFRIFLCREEQEQECTECAI